MHIKAFMYLFNNYLESIGHLFIIVQETRDVEVNIT